MTVAAQQVTARSSAIDRMRGLAIVLMCLDHLMLVLELNPLLRWGPTRLAMPLFMLIAGSLITRLTWRHLAIGVIGLGLPLFVPWTGQPNILFCYAIGAAVVVVSRRLGGPVPVILLAGCIAMLTNGLDFGSYPVLGVVALVLLGSMLPRGVWEPVGSHLPEWLEWLGRWPLTIYVGHLLYLRCWQLLIEGA